jgi:hypothetical protein
MNRLRHFCLRADRWQMCLLFFGVCIVGQFLGPIVIISAAPSAAGIGRAQVLMIGLLAVTPAIVFLSWLWFIGSFLRSAVRPSMRPRGSFFRVAIIYPLAFAFAELGFIIATNSLPVSLTVPTGIFAFFCLLYDLNFVTKTLFLAETGEPPQMGDGSATFLQLSVFPVGAWFIQPRINRLYSERERLRIFQ